LIKILFKCMQNKRVLTLQYKCFWIAGWSHTPIPIWGNIVGLLKNWLSINRYSVTTIFSCIDSHIMEYYSLCSLLHPQSFI
jgi:hypothetical protein